jgi:small ligand-binding sensory domain FIST
VAVFVQLLVRGALLFSCHGRGMRMFGRPDHAGTDVLTSAPHRAFGPTRVG